MNRFLLFCNILQFAYAQYSGQVRQKDDAEISLPLAPLTGRVVQRHPPLLNGIIFVGDDHLPNGRPGVGLLEAPGPQSASEGSAPGTGASPGSGSAPGTTPRPRRTRKPTTQANQTEPDTTIASQSEGSSSEPPISDSTVNQETELPTTENPDYNIYVVRSCNVVQCNPTSVCKVIDNEAKCIPTVGEKRGLCPAKGESSKPQDDKTCATPCVDDQSCADDLKCCTIDCGKSCHKPRPYNPCEPKPCPKGTQCKPEIKSCLENSPESPCHQYRCDPIATTPAATL